MCTIVMSVVKGRIFIFMPGVPALIRTGNKLAKVGGACFTWIDRIIKIIYKLTDDRLYPIFFFFFFFFFNLQKKISLTGT